MEYTDFHDKLARHLIDEAKDELDVVLRGFLIAEFYVNDFLEAKLPNGKVISNSSLNFRTKLEIIKSVDPQNLLTEYIEQLREFSGVRNRFAHRLDYKLQEGDIEKLSRSIGLDKTRQSAIDKKGLLRIIIMQILANIFTSFLINKTVHTELSLADKVKRLRKKE